MLWHQTLFAWRLSTFSVNKCMSLMITQQYTHINRTNWTTAYRDRAQCVILWKPCPLEDTDEIFHASPLLVFFSFLFFVIHEAKTNKQTKTWNMPISCCVMGCTTNKVNKECPRLVVALENGATRVGVEIFTLEMERHLLHYQ